MKKITPLFVAYFYPPAGGAGLPGSQRTVKFIRYMEGMDSKYILSISPECYLENLKLDFNMALPVNNESIVRTASYDRFQKAMTVRKRVSGLFKKKDDVIKDGVLNGTDQGYFSESKSLSFTQRIKDFIHHAYYSPDMVAPWINQAVAAGVDLVCDKGINVIFTTGMPWSALVVGRLISKKTGVPFIADFRDPWMGNPFLKSKGRFIDRRESACERDIVTSAALITANTEPLRNIYMIKPLSETDN